MTGERSPEVIQVFPTQLWC